LIATAIDGKAKFLDSITKLNNDLNVQMSRTKYKIKANLDHVPGGYDERTKKQEDGRVYLDENGNTVIIQEYVPGYNALVLAIRDDLINRLGAIQNTQEGNNTAAVDATGDADTESSTWLDEAAMNEANILKEFLEKGFAFMVDTSEFITHTTHPYAPFSTGDYNSLVDQINGFEQFFDAWDLTKTNCLATLDNCKKMNKSDTETDVFEVDVPALETFCETQNVESNDALDTAVKIGDSDLGKA